MLTHQTVSNQQAGNVKQKEMISRSEAWWHDNFAVNHDQLMDRS